LRLGKKLVETKPAFCRELARLGKLVSCRFENALHEESRRSRAIDRRIVRHFARDEIAGDGCDQKDQRAAGKQELHGEGLPAKPLSYRQQQPTAAH